MIYYNCLMACLLALAGQSKAHLPAQKDAVSQYAYKYAVKDIITGDNKGHWEKRNGDVVKGSYSSSEPDGTVRVVDYAFDGHSGFNAAVKRYGTAAHPTNLIITPTLKAAPIASQIPIAQNTQTAPIHQVSLIPQIIPVVPLTLIPLGTPTPAPKPALIPFTISIKTKKSGPSVSRIYVNPEPLHPKKSNSKPVSSSANNDWIPTNGPYGRKR